MNCISKIAGPLAFASLMALPATTHAAPGSQSGCPNINPSLPIAVAADESEFQKIESRVVLKGSVTITQGVLTLYADKVTVNYHSGDTRDKGTQGTITSLVAKGTVKFECEGDRAHGRVAIYDVSQHHIKMTGDVLLVRDNNILKGQTLFIDLDTGNTTIEGGAALAAPEEPKDTRIKAVFTPAPSKPDNGKPDNGKPDDSEQDDSEQEAPNE